MSKEVKVDLRTAALAHIAQPLCPNCGERVQPVTQGNSYLNSDQFDAIRAGDWYCTNCPEDVGTAKKSRSGFAYFWDKDIAGIVENKIVGDYFDMKRQLSIAHDKLLKAFEITERNDFEVKDLRDRRWCTYSDASGTVYIRFSTPDGTTAVRMRSDQDYRQGGLMLTKVSFDVGGPMYFLFSEINQVDSM